MKTQIFNVVMFMLIIGLVGCSAATSTITEPVTLALAKENDPVKTVSAEAFVVPVKKAVLSFEVSGRVVEILAHEGDVVKKGMVLAHLDDTISQAHLKEKVATLETQRINLEQAKAELAKLTAPPTKENIAAQEAKLAKAEALLAQKLAGPTKQAVAEINASIRTAKAELTNELAGNRAEELQRQAAVVLSKEATVRQKQADYDRVRYGDPKDVSNTGVALQQATLDYEQAKADYDKLVNGSTKQQIAIKEAQVAEKQAKLSSLLAGSTPEEIAQYQADVAQQEAEMAKLVAGATAEEIKVSTLAVKIAETNVASAQAQVDRAKAELAQYHLIAPFDGVIGLIDFDEGDLVQGHDKAITMGDFSRWQVETDDLTEIDIVKVEVGQPITVKADALPQIEYQGQVVRVNPRSETKSGDVTYTVLVDITSGDTTALKWGMTTYVDIKPN